MSDKKFLVGSVEDFNELLKKNKNPPTERCHCGSPDLDFLDKRFCSFYKYV